MRAGAALCRDLRDHAPVGSHSTLRRRANRSRRCSNNRAPGLCRQSLEGEQLMMQANVTVELRRPSDRVAVIDIQGEITAFAEPQLMDAYTRATTEGADAIVLNFAGLD